MASRGSLGVLESTSSTSLNKLHGSLPPSKKRKLYHNGSAGFYTSSFSIRAHNPTSEDKTLTLEPIVLLPRSRLPLSWLDVSSGSSKIQAGHLFMANIPDLEDDLQERNEPIVLVARLSCDSGLCVIERVKRGIYAVCGLGHWVEEGDLFVAAKGWRRSEVSGQETKRECSGEDDKRSWWDVAKIEENDVLEFGSSTKGTRLDVSVVFGSREDATAAGDEMDATQSTLRGIFDGVQDRRLSIASRSMEMERSFSADVVPTPPQEQHDAAELVPPTNLDGEGNINIAEATQSPDELLDGLRIQYLEALYISKTSVAYFAKGPLTRCRTAFQSSNHESAARPTDLANFYRDAILPVKKMDLKYRETLPAMIHDVALASSEDEKALRTRNRKSKKKKLGRDGLYPEEQDLIRRWWKSRSLTETAASTQVTREGEAKRCTADLRLRETQLQILLILETIALEAAVSTAPTDLTENQGHGETTKKSKAKKAEDLNVLLEILVDRLCIWHAVSFGDAIIADSAKADENSHFSGKKIESDILRDFCTEVIIPFYAPRLPDQCKSIVRKLGGPNAVSPTWPTPQSKSSSRPQPGAAVKRPRPQKTRRTLQRVLTDEQVASQRRRPSLLRSNTAPSVQEVKRESMEPSLPSLSASVRGGIQKAKRVDNREVDLNAVAKQHEVKLKKMNMLIDQKKELDAAINALKKPNRELIAKDIADAAERRVSSSSARKSKNPVRNPLGQGVQVMATPKGSRKKDVTFGLPQPKGLVRSSTRQEESSPPFGSDVSMVPASAVRPTHASETPGSKAFLGSDVDHGDINSIHETPSRGPSKLSNPLVAMVKEGADLLPTSKYSGNLFKIPNLPTPRSAPDFAPSTPISSRGSSILQVQQREPVPLTDLSSAVHETPPRQSTEAPIVKDLAPPSSPLPVLDTPVKSGPRRTALAPPSVPMTPEKSIYEQLGWDDDELAL